MRIPYRTPAARLAFTIIELLVAMGIALTLLGLAVAVSQSSAFDSYKIVGSADRVSQWMLVAKNRALRDRAPRGVRLILDATGSTCREIAYIEMPEPYIVPPLAKLQLVYEYQAATPAKITKRVFLTVVSLSDFQASVSPQDLVYLTDFGMSFRIETIIAGPPGTTIELTVANPVQLLPASPANPPQSLPDLGAGYSNPATVPVYVTSNFGIYRQARPLLGEPTQQLPLGMVIDLKSSVNNNIPLVGGPGGNRDILFAPSGEVMFANEGLIVCLMRDINRNTDPLPIDLTNQAVLDKSGQMILIAIYPKTGAIATQNVAPASVGDPYKFAKDGINTGL